VFVTPLTLVAIVYWLALAAWFGAAVFIAMAAPVIHRVTREADPTLPMVLSVNLDGQHSSLLGGRLVGELLSLLTRVELWCGVTLVVAQAGEWMLTFVYGYDPVLPFIRTGLLALAGGMAVYAGRSLRPKASAARQEYVDHADEPDVANDALDRFERLGRDVVAVLMIELVALAGLVLFAAIGLGIRGGITLGG
jgi:hypothetical protein